MVDAVDAIDKARAAMSERADLPGMSLMEHLDELRKAVCEWTERQISK